jgi:integrase
MARGSITKLTNKDGTTTYYIHYRTPAGKQIKRAIGSRKKDAERELDDVMRQINQGLYSEKKDITFGDLTSKWLEGKKLEVRENTLAAYVPAVNRLNNYAVLKDKTGEVLLYLKDTNLKKIDAEICEDFKTDMATRSLNAWTISRNIIIMKSLFDKAVEWGYLQVNPARFIKSPSIVKREMEFFTLNEVKVILNEVDTFYRPLTSVIAYTGLRLSEALGMSWCDVDFKQSKLFVKKILHKGKFADPKTVKSKRCVDIPEFLVEELKVHQINQAVNLPRNDFDLLFTDRDGFPLNTDKLAQKILRPAIRKAGIKEPEMPFHALRHTYASIMASLGADLKYLQDQMGHSSFKVTKDLYTHIYPESRRIEMQKLNEQARK